MSNERHTKPSSLARVALPLLTAALAAVSASATTYTDIDEFLPDGIALDSSGANDHYNGIFDIRTGEDAYDQDGFDPATQDATSGWVLFALGTSREDTQEFKVYLDDVFNSGTQFLNETWVSAFGLSAQLLLEISETGTLSYKITAESGQFNLYGAMLEVEATGPVSAVPDGGVTAMLLGFGVLGLASMRAVRRS